MPPTARDLNRKELEYTGLSHGSRSKNMHSRVLQEYKHMLHVRKLSDSRMPRNKYQFSGRNRALTNTALMTVPVRRSR